jgi:hypothetical protein
MRTPAALWVLAAAMLSLPVIPAQAPPDTPREAPQDVPPSAVQTAGTPQVKSSNQPVQEPASPNRGATLTAKNYLVDTGTHVPLALINSISTKNAVEGDRVYLETVFPILADGRIVIPPGSYVLGTITSIKRPGKVKGRGEFHLRFDSLTLPNGTTRDFRAHLTGLDGESNQELDRNEGTIRGEGNKAGDLGTIARAGAAGAGVGALAGIPAGSSGMGAAIGAGAGAAAALVGIMLTRGPDAVLAKGTTVEMILDRQLQFSESELDFSNAFFGRSSSPNSNRTPTKKDTPSSFPGVGNRF